MEIGKLTLSGIEALTILDMKIKAGINEHASLELKCIVDKSKVLEYMDRAASKKEIILKESDRILFCGYIKGAECQVKQKYAQMTIYGTSGSCKIDQEKKTRSYQDITESYQSILAKKADFTFYEKAKPIENLVVQYQETDWEFIKRLSSKFYLSVYPDMTASGVKIQCGVDEKHSPKEIPVFNVTIKKELEKNDIAKANGSGNRTLQDACCYYLESDAFCKVGDAVLYNGKKLYIDELECHMGQAGFHGVYRAKTKAALECVPVSLYHMPGAALEGKIIAVEGEKVKVHLTVDEKQEKEKAYWFPFSTMQSAADGSGWYYMPELGDSVKVCIPGWEEQGAFAVSAVSTYQGNAGEEDRMSDTNVKYMRNPSGKQINLEPDSIKADGGGKASLLQMDTQGNILLAGKELLQITASETIEITSDKAIEIEAEKNIDVKADTTGEIILDENGEVTQLGGQVNINSEE